jgi:hypothetical protein
MEKPADAGGQRGSAFSSASTPSADILHEYPQVHTVEEDERPSSEFWAVQLQRSVKEKKRESMSDTHREKTEDAISILDLRVTFRRKHHASTHTIHCLISGSLTAHPSCGSSLCYRTLAWL